MKKIDFWCNSILCGFSVEKADYLSLEYDKRFSNIESFGFSNMPDWGDLVAGCMFEGGRAIGGVDSSGNVFVQFNFEGFEQSTFYLPQEISTKTASSWWEFNKDEAIVDWADQIEALELN